MMFVALATIVGFSSCDDDDKENDIPVNAIENEVVIDASSYTDWVYFSISEGKIVGTSAIDEERAGLDWDIAFHRWDVRLNSGESGDGNGGAYLATDKIGKTGWDALITVPEGISFTEDGKIVVNYDMSTMPPGSKEVSGSDVITGGMPDDDETTNDCTWLKMSYMGQGGPSYEVTNQIFIVKTAEGKYAKIWLKQYLNAEKKSGHITMKYAYQEDGSVKLN